MLQWIIAYSCELRAFLVKSASLGKLRGYE